MPKSSAKKLAYQADTGLFVRDGAVVDTTNAAGYVVLRVGPKIWYAHRLAWAMAYGYLPKMLDHVNGDKKDNRLCNLRETTSSVNCQNKALKHTPHGYPPGAHWHAPSQSFKSAVQVDGESIHLGYFKTAEDASKAYKSAKLAIHDIKELRYA